MLKFVFLTLPFYRDKLREQHQLSEEIAQVITSNPIGEMPDETELDEELEGLEQEAMDERMLKTGTVPVADKINMLPAAANGERTFYLGVYLFISLFMDSRLTFFVSISSQRQDEASRRRRRGSRIGKASCGNGHGMKEKFIGFLFFFVFYPPF